MALWLTFGITALVLIAVAFRIDDWGRDWSQNTAELTADADRPGLRPLEINATPEAVAAAVEDWAMKQSQWDIVEVRSEGPDGSIELKLTRTSKLFRFVDDVGVTLSLSDETTAVDASSASRVGKGDLGQNPRNLIELTDAIRDAFPGTQ
ncbi:MAG: DUF1499 domain-containing protein [Planctomycetota bacterium]